MVPTPTTTAEKKKPARTISADRWIIAELRRVNFGFPESQYYQSRVPVMVSLARLSVSASVSFPVIQIEMDKRDIASAFRPMRLLPSLSPVRRTEIPGAHFQHSEDLVLFNLANFAIFGDAISTIHSRFGMNNPDWRTSLSILSRLYVDDDMMFGIKNIIRQKANSDACEWIREGLQDSPPINDEKLELSGKWGPRHTLTGSDVDSENINVQLPDPKIAGARILSGRFCQLYPSRAVDLQLIQQVRGAN